MSSPPFIPPGYSVSRQIRDISNQIVWELINTQTKLHYISTYINIYPRRDDVVTKYENKVKELKKIYHPAIRNPFKVYFKNDNRYVICIVAENTAPLTMRQFLDKYALFNKGCPVTLRHVFQILIGVASGLFYLHENGFVHGNLSLDTVFIDPKYYPYHASFGVFDLERCPYPDIHVFEDLVAAPELQNEYKPNFASDVFAFAMFTFEIFVKYPEFKDKGCLCLSERIYAGQRPNIPDFIPLFIKHIIERAWVQDPSKRPQMHEVVFQLREGIDSFLKNITTTDYDLYESLIKDFLPAQFNKRFSSVVDSLPDLSPKGRQMAAFYIDIQTYITSVEQKKYKAVFDWLCKHIDPEKGCTTVLRAFFAAAQCRYDNPMLIAKLFSEIVLKFKRTPLENLPMMFTDRVFQMMQNSDPYPVLCGPVALLFHLSRKKVIDSKIIVLKIRSLYEETACKRNVCLVFAWFAPDCEQFDKPLFDSVIKMLKEHSDDDFFNDAYKSFIENLSTYRKGKWAFYKEKLMNGLTLDPEINMIRLDDLIAFKDAAEDQSLFLKKSPPDIFEPCQFASERMTVPSYAALYGASRIFHYLTMARAVYVEGEKTIRKLPFAAVCGGSAGILTYLEQKCDFLGTLQCAAMMYRSDIFDMLLTHNHDMTMPDKSGKLAISSAAAANNVYAMLRCIGKGVMPETAETFGWTSLHAAAEKGSVEALTVLLELEKINVNSRDIWGMTPLLVACDRGQIEAATVLLNHKGVDVNIENEEKKTAAHFAAETGDVELMRAIKRKGACLSVQTTKGTTPLHIAAEGKAEMVKYLLAKKGVDPCAKDAKGRTAYDIAVKKKNQEVIDVMLEFSEKKGCNIA